VLWFSRDLASLFQVVWTRIPNRTDMNLPSRAEKQSGLAGRNTQTQKTGANGCNGQTPAIVFPNHGILLRAKAVVAFFPFCSLLGRFNRINKSANIRRVIARQNGNAVRLQTLQRIGDCTVVGEGDCPSSIIAETNAGMGGAAPG
jgi:hypothetical protein